MNFEFTENSVIMIPITYRGYRLADGEKVRFRCCFKNYEGDFPYTLDIEEDNKGEGGADGKYTISLDMGRYSISPGRYSFDLSLVLESGSLVTIKTKAECHINVIPAEEGLYKPNGEVFFGADFIVEEGKIGNWYYLKKNSGVAECWGTHHFTSGMRTQVANSGFYCGEFVSFNLPSGLFASVSYEKVSIRRSSSGLLNAVYMARTDEITPEKITFVPYRDGETTANNTGFYASIEIKGRWK